MFTIKKHKLNYSMRNCVNRDGETTFMMTSQTRINKSGYFPPTRNKRQEATIIIFYVLLTVHLSIFILVIN